MKGSINFSDSYCRYSVIQHGDYFKATFTWKSKMAWGRKTRLFHEEDYGIKYINNCIVRFHDIRQYYNLTGALIE